MNLHEVLPNVTRAIWVTAMGMRYRRIGTHIWMLEEGTPPEFAASPHWIYTNARFSWQPYIGSGSELFLNGWVAPLCGKRSTSRRPTGELSFWTGCHDCRRIASERGIVPLTREEAFQSSEIYRETQREAAAWRNAGRPAEWQWPPPQA